MVMSKKGISAIVATVLVILITIAAVVIIWAAVVPIIQEGVEGFGDVRVSLTIVEDGYTVWDAAARAAMIQVKRGVDDADVAAIQFYFKDDKGNSHNATRSSVPDTNEMKTYAFYFNAFEGDPTSVSIAAVFADGSLSEILSTVEPLPSGDLGGSVIDVSEGNPSTTGGSGGGAGSWPGDGSVTVVGGGECAGVPDGDSCVGGFCLSGACFETLLSPIATCGELEGMMLDGNYILIKDIECGTYGNFNEIAPYASLFPFTGELDGNNKKIIGLTMNNPGQGYFGMFSWVEGASIHDFTLEGVDIVGGRYTGALAGYTGTSTITNVHVVGGSVTGYDEVGGLIGSGGMNSLQISDSSSSASVSGDNSVGGLIGTSSGQIYSSHATGLVTSSSGISVGGLVGEIGFGGFVGAASSHDSVTTGQANCLGSVFSDGQPRVACIYP